MINRAEALLVMDFDTVNVQFHGPRLSGKRSSGPLDAILDVTEPHSAVTPDDLAIST